MLCGEMPLFYINTSEKPGELSQKDDIFTREDDMFMHM